MKRAIQFLGRTLAAGAGVVGSFALWSLWLVLVLLVALQCYILSVHELAVPKFALRELETRLARSGLRATFSRTTFDPSGRILAENAQLSLPAFPEPVVTVRSVYIRLNPWMLVVGRLEPREIRLVGGAAAVPAMLSPTGRPAEVLTQIEATLEPADKTLTIHQLSGRIAGVVVSVHGTLVLERRTGRPLAEAVADFITNRFPVLCRQALEVAERVSHFDEPSLRVELTPSPSGAAAMNVTVLARTARLEQPFAARATGLRASTRLLLLGENPTSWLEFSASELNLPGNVRARGVRGDVYGRFQGGAFFFEPRELTVTADAVEAAGFSAESISGQVFPRPLPRIDVAAVARVAGAPLALRAEADIKDAHASVAFEGEIAPALLTPLSDRLRVDVRKFFDFSRLAVERGEVRLGAGWKFEKLLTRVRVDGVNAYGVRMTDGRAVIELDPQRFYSPDAFARVGENFARGSYEQDLRSLDFRFLLQGRLRPLELSPWFREWWTDFFQDFEFPVAPPVASVDVRGRWREGHRTSVFVFADAAKSIVRGAELDRVRTRLFIRPGFFDGLELSTTRGEGVAKGRFTFINDPGPGGWKSLDLALASTLDLATLAKIGGPAGARFAEPFQLSNLPSLRVTGHFTGPGSTEGERQDLRIDARTTGEFRFHNFPLNDPSFVLTFKDDQLVIDDFEAQFGGGAAAGHARVWGAGDQRRVGFDFSLSDASLGQVAGTVQQFFARQKGQTEGQGAPLPGKFVKEKANVKLDFAASAEGNYHDLASFRGEGNASLQGPEIAEISLLGLLSDVLKFTALRFTEAQANFKIEGAKIVFPEVKFRGPSAAIDAHGSYAVERRELDFNARIFPFQESENLIKSVVGAVLTPISNTFEVKLGGSLEKPEWAVTVSPTNLLRSLTPGAGEEKEKAEPPKNGAPANGAKSAAVSPRS